MGENGHGLTCCGAATAGAPVVAAAVALARQMRRRRCFLRGHGRVFVTKSSPSSAPPYGLSHAPDSARC
jgi:hypothetical protein